MIPQPPPVTRQPVATIEPSFEAVLALVAEGFDLSPEAVRTLDIPAATRARACFVWLCDQVKERATFAAAAYVGMPQGDALGAIAAVDKLRETSLRVAAQTDEMALILHVEAVTLDRLALSRPGDPDPELVARRVLGSRRAAIGLPIEVLQQLAAAYLTVTKTLHARDAEIAALIAERDALRDRVDRVPVAAQIVEQSLCQWVKAHRALATASPGFERKARETLDAAAEALAGAAGPRFGIHARGLPPRSPAALNHGRVP